MLSMIRRSGLRAASVVGAAALACAWFSLAARPLAAAEPLRLRLAEVHALAESNSIELRKALTDVDVAQAAAEESRALFNANPQLTGEFGRRRIEAQRGHDWSVGLSQELEIAGQPRLRREAFALELDALRQAAQEIRHALRLESERRFIHVLALQDRLRSEREAMALVERSTEIVRKRFAAGDHTRLDANLAEVEAGRLRNQTAQLEEQLADARVSLSQFLQLGPGTTAEAVGELQVRPLGTSVEVLADAIRQRPGIRSLSLREQAAVRRLDLERASRFPNLTIGVTTGQEAVGIVPESITTISLSLPLPLFKRNQVGAAQAASELMKVRTDREVALRDMRAGVMALSAKLESLEKRVTAMQRDVSPRLDENLRLSQISFAAGEISLSEVLLLNRQAIDARRDIHDAIVEHTMVRLDLQQAAGLPAPGEQP